MRFSDYFVNIKATGINVIDRKIILYKNEEIISTLYFDASIHEINFKLLFSDQFKEDYEYIYAVKEAERENKNWIYVLSIYELLIFLEKEYANNFSDSLYYNLKHRIIESPDINLLRLGTNRIDCFVTNDYENTVEGNRNFIDEKGKEHFFDNSRFLVIDEIGGDLIKAVNFWEEWKDDDYSMNVGEIVYYLKDIFPERYDEDIYKWLKNVIGNDDRYNLLVLYPEEVKLYRCHDFKIFIKKNRIYSDQIGIRHLLHNIHFLRF